MKELNGNKNRNIDQLYQEILDAYELILSVDDFQNLKDTIKAYGNPNSTDYKFMLPDFVDSQIAQNVIDAHIPQPLSKKDLTKDQMLQEIADERNTTLNDVVKTK